MNDILTSVLVLGGGFFALLGGLGLVRLPDVLIRMHASTKIGTLASGLTVLGVAVHFGTTEAWIRAVAIILLLLLTAPIGAHMVGRAAVSTGIPLWKTRDHTKSAPQPDPGTPDAPDQDAAPRLDRTGS